MERKENDNQQELSYYNTRMNYKKAFKASVKNKTQSPPDPSLLQKLAAAPKNATIDIVDALQRTSKFPTEDGGGMIAVNDKTR